MRTPDPERQVQFLFDVQRLISDGSFVATYKFALLLALADLAVERGDDTTESLPLDTLDLAEKFVDLYWRQVLPWVPASEGTTGRLAQARGKDAAVLNAQAEHGGATVWQRGRDGLLDLDPRWRDLLLP